MCGGAVAYPQFNDAASFPRSIASLRNVRNVTSSSFWDTLMQYWASRLGYQTELCQQLRNASLPHLFEGKISWSSKGQSTERFGCKIEGNIFSTFRFNTDYTAIYDECKSSATLEVVIYGMKSFFNRQRFQITIMLVIWSNFAIKSFSKEDKLIEIWWFENYSKIPVGEVHTFFPTFGEKK